MELDRVDFFELITEALGRFGRAFPEAHVPTPYAAYRRVLVPAARLAREPGLDAELGGGARRLVLPVRANAIRVGRTAVRIFNYAGGAGHTAKVRFARQAWPAGEILPAGTHLRAPAVLGRIARIAPPGAIVRPLAVDPDGWWYVEPIVAGRRITQDEVHGFLDLWLPYYRAIARHRPLRRLAGADALVADLARIAPGLPRPSPDNRMPFVLGHGDLSMENILTTPSGALVAVDWDTACVLPMAVELALLYREYPGARDDLLAALATFDGGGASVPPVTQLALGVLHRSTPLRAGSRAWFREAMLGRGMSRKEAQRFRREQIGQIDVFVRSLGG